MIMRVVAFCFLALSIFSCRQENDKSLFRLLSPHVTGVDFINSIVENDSVNLLDYEYVYNGGGVAVADVNMDGLPDLFFSGNMVPSRLYLNQGSLKFKDITQSAGISAKNWATGVSVADINADGFPDIYVCSAGNFRNDEKRANLLYINNGNNTFTESAKAFGLADTGYSTMAAFLDYDLDKDLDLYVVTYANDTWDTSVIYPKITDGTGVATDRLYRNNGNGTFTNVSKEAGILVEGYGLGISICDLNEDGWPDIYVSNDYIDDDFLYLNNQNGTFTESASKYFKHTSQFAMGNDIADINNDGHADIVVVDMQPEDNSRQKLFSATKNYNKFMMGLRMGYLPAYTRNTLQLNNGDGTFSEIGQLAGIHQTDWSWAPLLADFDNDGLKDLFISNGYPKDIMNRDFLVFNKYAASYNAVKMPATLKEQHRFRLQGIEELKGSKVQNYFYRNNGDLTFSKKSTAWGIHENTFSNGAAYADLDRDGDLDLVVNNINDPASIYENRADEIEKNNYLRLKLEGDPLNPAAFGATVKLYTKGNGVQFLEQSPYRGFESTVEPVLHFGLGSATVADSIVIKWPDGNYSKLTDVRSDQVLTVNQNQSIKRTSDQKNATPRMFSKVTADLGIQYVHNEADYNDFEVEPLLPHKFSQNGPGIAVGDVNGDHLPDFYVGGTPQLAGALYLQTAGGKFQTKRIKQNPVSEDHGALLFDADNDDDLDLYVVSGGCEQMAESHYYQDRLYKNDGQGNFTHDASALPRMFESGSCVIAADYDKDGDLDLFIGGSVHPGKYPLPGKSYLLRNDGGKFSDVTPEAGKEFQRIGLVTAALWTDFDNDGQVDLMVVGEWMPITIFKNENGRFSNVTEKLGLHHSTGWWNSLVSGDFDNDGDMDYVAGNTGRNSRYQPSGNEPLTLYAKDFDDNGTLDEILTYYIQGKEQTVASRDEMVAQINFMRKRFPKYSDFAAADFSGIFKGDELKGAYVLRTEMFESMYIENRGKGKFAFHPLPVEAQFAPLFGMNAFDVDLDGNLDLVGVGNSYAPEISLGRYDASFGVCLKGDGKGNFKTFPKNGFMVDGDAKGLGLLSNAKGEAIFIATRNGGPVDAFVCVDEKQTIIHLQALDAWAELTFQDGTKRKQELSYGTSYLSQCERALAVPEGVVSVKIFSYSGKSREASRKEQM
jgi:hypothetical protein